MIGIIDFILQVRLESSKSAPITHLRGNILFLLSVSYASECMWNMMKMHLKFARLHLYMLHLGLNTYIYGYYITVIPPGNLAFIMGVPCERKQSILSALYNNS